MANTPCQNMYGELILFMLKGYDTLYFFVLLRHLCNSDVVLSSYVKLKMPNCIYDLQFIRLFLWVQSFHSKQLYVTQLYMHFMHVGVIYRYYNNTVYEHSVYVQVYLCEQSALYIICFNLF